MYWTKDGDRNVRTHTSPSASLTWRCGPSLCCWRPTGTGLPYWTPTSRCSHTYDNTQSNASLSQWNRDTKTKEHEASDPLPLDSSSKLKELLSLWDWEDTDDCALRGSERCTGMTSSDTDPNLLSWKTKITHKRATQADALSSNCLTFSEAVASLVPLASKARAANGLSWAGIILAARWKANSDSS